MSDQKVPVRLLWSTFFLSLITTVLVGIWALVQFNYIELPVSEADLELKKAHTQIAKIETADKLTPILGVVPLISEWQSDTGMGLRFPRITIVLENLGFASIEIGEIGIVVEH